MDVSRAGSLIAAARLQAGLTQTELAERAGTTQPTISAYERGAKTPDLATLAGSRPSPKPPVEGSRPDKPNDEGPAAPADPAPLSDEAAAAISVLHRHRVRFVVIGGFAIQLHGVDGLARTSDIDVTPERSRVNLERLAAALSTSMPVSAVTGFAMKASL